jgi:cysteine sulfinate desulfinase/cysteine desulfurase-like protein
MPEESKRMAFLRDKLRGKLESELDEVYINGTMEHRLPNNLNISFAYVEGESLLMGINDIAVSSGSACTSATLEPSYVLKALGAGRRSGAFVDPIRPRPLQHRRRSGLRGGESDRRGEEAARAFAAL